MKNFKKLIAVVVMAAVCCVMAGPTVVSAEETAGTYVAHNYVCIRTDRVVVDTYWHEYEGNNEPEECQVTVYYMEYTWQCTHCVASYITSTDYITVHGQCGE